MLLVGPVSGILVLLPTRTWEEEKEEEKDGRRVLLARQARPKAASRQASRPCPKRQPAQPQAGSLDANNALGKARPTFGSPPSPFREQKQTPVNTTTTTTTTTVTMANGAPLGPQPDFNLIATEFLKVPNMPAIAGGQQILAELREMRQQWTRDTAAIRLDVADTRRDLIAMMTASYV